MMMGMTYEQFWDGDVEMAPAFRKAHELRQEQANYDAWLRGLYTYEAIVDCVPVLRALSKAKRPAPYPTKPYELQREIDERERQDKERAKLEQIKTKMEAHAAMWNKRRKALKASDGKG